MNDKALGFSPYQMVPRENLQYKGIISLLLHYRWTWIGALVADTDSGERFMHATFPEFSMNRVCVAFVERIPTLRHQTEMSDILKCVGGMHDTIMDSKVNVLVVYGESHSLAYLTWLPYISEREGISDKALGKVFIMTAQMEFSSFSLRKAGDAQIFHGALSFKIQSKDLPGFQQFIGNGKPLNPKGGGFIRDFWLHTFGCVFPDMVDGKMDGNVCTGEANLETFHRFALETSMTGPSYNIYNSVYAVAHALDVMLSARLKHGGKIRGSRPNLQIEQQWEVN